MQKQIQKIDSSLEKIEKGYERIFEFVNPELIYSYLKKREKILSKTKWRILKLSKKAMVESFTY